MDTRQPTPRSRRWRRVGAVLTAIALGIGVAALLSQTAAFRDWVRREVVARVNVALAGRLAVGRLDGNLFGRLVATDVRLVLDEQRILALRRVTVTYDLLALLGGGLTINTLEVDGATLVLAADDRGWNVERLTATPRADHDAAKLDVQIAHVRITNGAVRIVTPTRAWRMRGLTLVGDARFAPAETRLVIAQLSLTEQGSGLRLEGDGRAVVGPESGWDVESLRLRTPGSHVEFTGRLGPNVAAELRVARLAAAELRALVGGTLQSDWRGEIVATGTRDAVRISGDVGAAITADEVERVVGRARVAGTLDLTDPRPRGALHGTLEGVDLAAIVGPRFPTTDLGGGLDLATGEMPETWRFALDLREPRVGTTTVPSVRAAGTVAAREWRVEVDVSAATGTAHAVATIEPRTERFDVSLRAHELDLAPLTSRPELVGRVNATMMIAGTGFAPVRSEANATLTLLPGRVGGVQIAAGNVEARVDHGRLLIARARLATDAASLEASGDLALATDAAARPASLKGELRATELGALGTLVGRPDLGGTATLTFDAHGSVTALDATVGVVGQGIHGSGWRAESIDLALTAERLGDPAGHATLTGQARTVVIGKRRLRDLGLESWWRGEARNGRAGVVIRGREVAAEHRLAAELTRSADTTQVTITELRLDHEGESWTAVGTPRLTHEGERLVIEDFVMESRRGSARAHGTLARTGPSALDVVTDGLDVEALSGLVPAQVRGRLVGRAHVGGTAAMPQVDANVVLESPTLGDVRYAELRAHLVAGTERVEWQGRLAQTVDRALDFDGALPVRFAIVPWRFEPAGGLRGRLHSDGIDLGFLGALWPDLVTKVAGTLTADLALGGALAAPEARGQVAVAGGRAYVVPLGLTYDPVDLAVQLEGRALSIERLAIGSGNGRLAGGGNARLGNGGAVMDARFEATRFPLFANEYGRGAASGWLWISGTTAAPVLEGSLATDGLVLQIPEVLPTRARPPDPTIVVVGPGAPPPDPIAPAPSAPPAAPVPGILERMAVTVQLSVPRDAWIRRSDANVELQGWLTAWKKQSEKLQLAGDIRGVRGWYAFQGKKFTLEEGSVRFSGQGLDPVLDIAATHPAGEYLVRLRVGGTVTKPTLALESEPALDQADVLAVLLFGAPASQLNRSQAIGLREQALGIAGGYVASELRQSVANALGVDDLQFDTGTTGLQDARVSVGKYVADDIFVSLAHRFGTESVEEVRIEWVIRPEWSLETSTDTLGRSGVDLFWKRRY